MRVGDIVKIVNPRDRLFNYVGKIVELQYDSIIVEVGNKQVKFQKKDVEIW